MKKKTIYLALAISLWLIDIGLLIASSFTDNQLLNQIGHVVLLFIIVFIYQYRLEVLREERDLFRKGYLRELQKNTLKEMPEEEAISYLHLN